MVDGVILAAGFSSRAGAYKMALDFHGKTVLQRNIEALYESAQNIIVVGGYRIEMVREMVRDYYKVNLVMNHNYEAGMFSSVQEGIRHVREERFFFTPGDYPLLSSDVCKKLLESKDDIVVPTFNGRRGHPVLINSQNIQEILQKDTNSSLKDFIRSKKTTEIEVNDEGILIDVDTPEAYIKAINFSSTKKV